MLLRIAFSLIAVAFAALAAPSYADETRWEVIRVYTLAGGQPVAVAVPAEWHDLGKSSVLAAHSALRFADDSGKRIEIPASSLEWASANKRVFRPADSDQVAGRAGVGS